MYTFARDEQGSSAWCFLSVSRNDRACSTPPPTRDEEITVSARRDGNNSTLGNMNHPAIAIRSFTGVVVVNAVRLELHGQVCQQLWVNCMGVRTVARDLLAVGLTPGLPFWHPRCLLSNALCVTVRRPPARLR